MSWDVVSLEEDPDLGDEMRRLGTEAWPEFLRNGDTPNWGKLFTRLPAFQIVMREPDGRVVAAGHTAPLVWDGTTDDLPATIDDIVTRGLEAIEGGRTPNCLSALAAIVSKDRRGRGLSAVLLKAMGALAAERGFASLIAPVRPTWKSLYPLIPFERYIRWTREDGAPFDPWIRVHARLGAAMLRVEPKALTVEGSVEEWERWTKMSFPESGSYVVPGALQPVEIDREADRGVYADPNVWMRHPVLEADSPRPARRRGAIR